MTWNPRDLSIHQKDPAAQEGFQLPAPPTLEAFPGSVRAPMVPQATPMVADVLEWTAESQESPPMPQDLQRALAYEGIIAPREWDTWRSMLLRGHYT